MENVRVIYSMNNQEISESAKQFFIASDDPLYIGIITRASEPLWNHLSRSKTTILDIDGKASEYSIPYRIEVGRNSIFFLKPES